MVVIASQEKSLDELADYDEEERVKRPSEKKKDEIHEDGKKGHVAIHASGFRDFLLKPELLRAIVDCGFEHPSEVQHECIPQAILGTDILCQAKSGMGKTAVFVLTTLQQLQPDEDPSSIKVVVLAHTRELAYQIKIEFDRFSKYLEGVRSLVCYGGVRIVDDVENLKTCPQILIGTPGRILALMQSKTINLEKAKHFIVDECDKCLEKQDMRRDITDIFMHTPRKKQTMMFSATLSPEVRATCKKYMQDPHEIYVDNESKLTLHGLLQYYINLTENKKNYKLTNLLDELEFNQVVIFVKSVTRARFLDKLLRDCNFPSIAIHSQMRQDERIEKYQMFKEFQKRILVATDLFGRGIDVEKVNIVINYDIPETSDTYLHRVGRAGRFGTKGLAITFVAGPEETAILNEVQNRFEVTVSEMPKTIDATSYINA